MGKILAIDYGGKRCGIADTDELKIIATAVDTVATKELLEFLTQYISKNNVEALVVGEPIRMGGGLSEIEGEIQKFLKTFAKKFPKLPIHRQDERLTSKMAAMEMVRAGIRKSKRAEKGNIDKVSAVLILQSFLEEKYR